MGERHASEIDPVPLTYAQAVALLESATVFGIHPSLDGIAELTGALGRPHDAFASIQVTGTNGKTSVTRLTEAILRAHGSRTGLYTSPHLERYPERIEVGGEPLCDESFARAVGAALAAARAVRGDLAVGTDAGYTEFELLTAAALWAFADAGVTDAVLEVGLGGRWDATSVVSPAVAVITGVGLDHTAILGDTLEQIAAEKAAIIRPGSTAVLGPGTRGVEAAFLERARACACDAVAVREVGVESPLPDARTARFTLHARPDSPGGATLLDVAGVLATYPDLRIGAPAYQAGNVATAVAAAEARLGRALEPAALVSALAGVRLPGRFELLREAPPLVVDGSHNPQAAAVLADAIADAWPDPMHRPAVLLGVLADKDARGIVEALAEVAGGFAVTQPESPRSLAAAELAELVRQVTGEQPRAFADIATALGELDQSSAEGLVVTGSLTTAGQARTHLLGGGGQMSAGRS